MNTDRVLKSLEAIILRITKDMKKQGETTSEKISSLAKMVNSYSRLLERSKGKDEKNIDIPKVVRIRNLSRS